MATTFSKALKKAVDGRELDGKDLTAFLEADGAESILLYNLADKVRSRVVGDDIHLRGIIEFSNYCSKNCLYCGLRKDNRDLDRYRLSAAEIVDGAGRAAALGCRTIVLQSGEDGFYTAGLLAEIIRTVKDEFDVAVTLSVGDRPRADYAIFKQAGADRYLLKHETSDARLFSALRPGTTLAGRLKGMAWLKELGYQVGSGNIVGLPGQGVKTLAADILLMRRMGVEMAGIGPFIPSSHTPLGSATGGSLEMALKTLAVTRLVLPRAHLPATTAAATVDPLGRIKALKCGANVIMPNMTPLPYRAGYCIYPGKAGHQETPEESLTMALRTIEGAGRRPARDYGHAFRSAGKVETVCPGQGDPTSTLNRA